ncbi:hypothetical protein [Metapseudomonas otitidis]|uniref:hypothetical protein n=1 Tax=Metapseudomonas otitidis TaxID=319939 RepID=UPI0013F64790|nr:hypothetical protein [Pseudomonas otitidis]
MKKSKINIKTIAHHLFSCTLFVFINELHLSLCKQFQTSFDAREYVPGAVTRLALLHMAISCFLMAVTPWRVIKVGIALLTSVSLAWLLLPYHPLRALFYCGLLLALSICAMAAESLIRRRYGVGHTT